MKAISTPQGRASNLGEGDDSLVLYTLPQIQRLSSMILLGTPYFSRVFGTRHGMVGSRRTRILPESRRAEKSIGVKGARAGQLDINRALETYLYSLY